MSKIISIEGNIGSGKTTLLNKIHNDIELHPFVFVAFEPVKNWVSLPLQDCNGKFLENKDLINAYYKEPKKYAFLFQMNALQSRCQDLIQIVKHNSEKIIVCERSIFTDCEIFAKMLFENDFLTPLEFHIYYQWYQFILNFLVPEIIGFIYLQIEPNTCLKRIIQRKRTGEDNISIEYLQNLHCTHEKWLKSVSEKTPVLYVNDSTNDYYKSFILNFYINKK